jgi:hypothetical protein
VIDLECSIDGRYWRLCRFVSLTLQPYEGQSYAVAIQNIVIRFYKNHQKAEKFRRSLEFQLAKLAIVLALAGASPRVIMVRRPEDRIEVIDVPSEQG